MFFKWCPLILLSLGIAFVAGCGVPGHGGDDGAGNVNDNDSGSLNENDNGANTNGADNENENENDTGGAVLPGAGVCGGQICGPSGAFTVSEFPTIADVDFDSFPDNPSRPYQASDGGRFWYVATFGDDSADGSADAPLATPEHALARATTGDVILVADGEYVVGADEYVALTLNVPGVTLAAENVGQVVFRPPANNEDVAIGIASTADDLIVDGFVLQGFREYGVLFGRLDSPQLNLVLKHMVIDGGEDGIRSEIPDFAPNATPVIEGLFLYDVLIRRAELQGFNCGEGPCDDVRLEALQVELPAGLEYNADGVAISAGDNIVVFNAEVTGAAGDGVVLYCSRVAVVNVVVHDVGHNGIKLSDGGDVINALVYNTGADAAIVFDPLGPDAHFRLLNCVVAYHARGTEAYAATVAYDNPMAPGHLDVINTIFYQNTGPLWVSPAYTLNVRNSIFFHSPFNALTWGDITVDDEESGRQPFTALEDSGGGCCNLGIVDPLFFDPDGGDYELLAESPARDVGTRDIEAFPDFDLYGNPRIGGEGVDLGPVETSPNGVARTSVER